jgi:energy-coupling factor transport system ATP-binding protein
LYMEAGQLVTDGPPAQVAAWLRNHRTAQAPVLARLFPDATTPMLRVSEIRHYVNQHVLTEPATMTTATEVRGKDPLLRIRGLTVSYAEHRKRTDEEILALDNCDMEVLPGEVMAIVGPNGSGKSTLLGVLAGLVKITSGKVSGPLVTRNVKKGRLQLNSPFGYLPQNTDELLSQETVAEELQFGYTLAHGSMSATAVEQTLVDFGLTEFRARNPRELSGGQRTLVGLASLVVAKPKLLLLDEPTRGFDMVHKEHLGGLLQDKAANGIPTLLVTHDMEFAATYASQLLFLHQGRVVLKGSPKTVFRQAMMFAPLVARALRVAAPDVVCLADAVERGWAT